MDIKVQHGVAIIPESKKTITVELEKAVNPERAVVLHGGSIYGFNSNSNNSGYWDAQIVLLDSKHIEVKRVYPSIYTAEVAWQVVEVIPDGEPQEPEKEKEIDWTKVPVDTPVLVRDDVASDWVERHFVAYLPNRVGHKFAVFNNCSIYNPVSQEEAVGIDYYYECKLADSVDPTPYYKD